MKKEKFDGVTRPSTDTYRSVGMRYLNLRLYMKNLWKVLKKNKKN